MTTAQLPERRAGRRRGLSPEIQIATGASHDGAPLHTRLYRQLRQHILAGALAPGARLPSGRTLAADLRVSRNTVETAIEQLVAEGFVVRRVGAGSRVAESLGEAAPFLKPRALPPARVGASPPAAPRAPRLAARGALMARLGQVEIDADAQAGPCSTHIDGFPRTAWNRFAARRARRGGVALLGTSPPCGLPELRRQIADYVTLTRGLRCAPDQVLVVSSTQQCLDLAARVLLDPGDLACVEDPGYPNARAAFLAAGARVLFVPVDDEGLVVGRLPTTRGRQLLYLTPSHQYPTGVTMSLARRLAVLNWAARSGAWVIEDDYDSEFRFDGRPLAALRALDTHERVLYVGTCNKVLFPGLRLAYMILPESLVGPFAAARHISDGSSSPLAQATLADFMVSGQFAAYVRQARHHYAERRNLLVAEATRAWGDAVRLGPSSTGLHLVAHLGGRPLEAACFAATRGVGMTVAALSRYYAGRPRKHGLLLGYGSASDAAIRATVERLARVFRAAPGRGPAGP